MEYDSIKLGNIINSELTTLGYSKYAFAKALRISRATLNRWINGTNPPPMESLFKMCSKEIKVDLGVLVVPTYEGKKGLFKEDPSEYYREKKARELLGEIGRQTDTNTYIVPMFDCELEYLLGNIPLKTRKDSDIYEATGLTPETISAMNRKYEVAYNEILQNTKGLFRHIDDYREDSIAFSNMLSVIPQDKLIKLFQMYMNAKDNNAPNPTTGMIRRDKALFNESILQLISAENGVAEIIQKCANELNENLYATDYQRNEFTISSAEKYVSDTREEKINKIYDKYFHVLVLEKITPLKGFPEYIRLLAQNDIRLSVYNYFQYLQNKGARVFSLQEEFLLAIHKLYPIKDIEK